MSSVPEPARGTAAGSGLDGDGWQRCAAGHAHWGRHGAAGLLVRVVDVEDRDSILLQKRAWWTHHGGTWGLPGGARASWETPEQTALRETSEEVVVALDGLAIERVHHDDHGGWAYWTVLATLTGWPHARPRGRETAEVRWVPVDDVSALALHPGFAATWPLIR